VVVVVAGLVEPQDFLRAGLETLRQLHRAKETTAGLELVAGLLVAAAAGGPRWQVTLQQQVMAAMEPRHLFLGHL